MPLLVGKYLYVHMPKTGGVWMTQYLKDQHDGLLLPGHGHMAASDVPGHHKRNREMFGTMRDPWGWYASWWAHALSNESEQPGLRAYGGGSTEFADVLQGVLCPQAKRVPKQIGVIWNIPKPDPEQWGFVARGVGLFSWAFNYIHGDEVRKLIDMAQMPEGLRLLMGGKVDLDRYPPTNTKEQRRQSAHNVDYKKLYTDKLAEMVWEADFDLINRLGYTQPFEKSSKALAIL
jgi:hypothetical protein